MLMTGLSNHVMGWIETAYKSNRQGAYKLMATVSFALEKEHRKSLSFIIPTKPRQKINTKQLKKVNFF